MQVTAWSAMHLQYSSIWRRLHLCFLWLKLFGKLIYLVPALQASFLLLDKQIFLVLYFLLVFILILCEDLQKLIFILSDFCILPIIFTWPYAGLTESCA
eukprot:c13279_g1_i1 orf=71-367(+)